MRGLWRERRALTFSVIESFLHAGVVLSISNLERRAAIACRGNGQACSRRIFVRWAGMFQTSLSRSNSLHSASRSSAGEGGRGDKLAEEAVARILEEVCGSAVGALGRSRTRELVEMQLAAIERGRVRPPRKP
jgi:hypothetical protein